jgi:YjbR
MTQPEFRRVALSLPATSEDAHMDHPDFRVRGKIFATVGYPNASWGMVKLTPEQQQEFVDAEPGAFVPVKGGWGRKGANRCSPSIRQKIESPRRPHCGLAQLRSPSPCSRTGVTPLGLPAKEELLRQSIEFPPGSGPRARVNCTGCES